MDRELTVCKSAFNIDPESAPKDDPPISLTYRFAGIIYFSMGQTAADRGSKVDAG